MTTGRLRAAPSTEPIDVGGFFSSPEGPDRLVVLTGREAGRTLVLNQQPITVGASEHADLRLTDATVSRNHARLLLKNGLLEVSDLGSTNGTFIAEHRVLHAFAKPGQTLRFGRTVVRISTGQSEAPLPHADVEFVGRSEAALVLAREVELAAVSHRPLVLRGEPGVGRRRVARLIHLKSGRLHFLAQPARALTKASAVPALHGNGTVLIEDFEHLPDEGAHCLAARLSAGAPTVRLMVSVTERRAISPAPRRLLEHLLLEHDALTLRVPTLRERMDDLPELVTRILKDLNHPADSVGVEELGEIQGRSWPDNLRGLKAYLQRQVAGREPTPNPNTSGPVRADRPYKEARSELLTSFERSYAVDLLSRHEGNVTKAAKAAGIDRVYLHRLIKKHHL